MTACLFREGAFVFDITNDIEKEEEFAAFLNNKGLKLVSSQRKNQWILYKIIKKPEGVI